jgi:hypothetical protein
MFNSFTYNSHQFNSWVTLLVALPYVGIAIIIDQISQYNMVNIVPDDDVVIGNSIDNRNIVDISNQFTSIFLDNTNEALLL